MTHNFHALALSDEDLMSIVYDEDTLSDEEEAHLAQCPLCQQRLTTYQRTNGLLRSKLFLRLCPSAVDLNYYCLGGLPPKERTSIAAHILDCPLCTEEVAEIRQLQANVTLFPVGTPSVAAAIRRFFATRVAQQLQPVTRDERPIAEWPRQYHAETIDLSLHLSRSIDGNMLLLGIITSTNPLDTVKKFEGGSVELYQAPWPLTSTEPDGQEGNASLQSLVSTQIDDIGSIVLEPITAGNYVMIIRLSGQEIIIEDIQV